MRIPFDEMKTKALCVAALVAALAALVAVAPAAGAHAHKRAEPSLASLLAPASACPGQADLTASASEQEATMRCLTNYARTESGLPKLAGSATLARAADHKALDIVTCDEFSHEACGHPFTYWMRQTGYLTGSCWEAAENIAFGSGRLGAVRKVFIAWMKSSGHRENILGTYADIGIGLRVGTLEGTEAAHVWTQEFGAIEC